MLPASWVKAYGMSNALQPRRISHRPTPQDISPRANTRDAETAFPRTNLFPSLIKKKTYQMDL